MRTLMLIIALPLLLAACAATPPKDDSLFQALGGKTGIEGIVGEFIFRLGQDSRVAHHFAKTDLDRLRDKLVEQFCAESGGGCTYTGDTMEKVHTNMKINEAQFNAVVEDLQAAMTARSVPAPVQNRLLRRLAPMRPGIIHR
jgi:hemoglobin